MKKEYTVKKISSKNNLHPLVKPINGNYIVIFDKSNTQFITIGEGNMVLLSNKDGKTLKKESDLKVIINQCLNGMDKKSFISILH